MTKLKIFTLACALLTICSCSAERSLLYLTCSVQSASGKTATYSFELDEQAPRLYWIDLSEEVVIERNTSSQLWGKIVPRKTGRIQFLGIDLKLNRITGQLTLSYFRPPRPEEVAKCGADAWCTADLIDQDLEDGSCESAKPKM